MAYDIGESLKMNMMYGLPTRTKSHSDYKGLVVPPCGDFAPGRTISPPPWKTLQVSEDGYSQLHAEIKAFTRYIQPTSKESVARNSVVTRFTSLVKELEPGTTVQAVGSSVTGLAFPTSDIDMIATFPISRLYPAASSGLEGLLWKLRGSGFASKVDSVLRASVPLIRITDAKTGIQIDLTASDNHGVRATRAVEEWIRGDDAEVIESLVKVVKLFLATRRLGTTYTGGVNSYMLTWMVIAWVKPEMPKLNTASSTQRAAVDDLASWMGGMSLGSSASASQRRTAGGKVDLGSALKAFFKFYAVDFSYSSRSIKFAHGAGFYIASKYASFNTQGFLLSIDDPANTRIDLGAKAYGIKHIRATFRRAYREVAKVEEGTLTSTESRWLKVQGVLGFILGGDYSKMEESRGKVTSR